MPLALVTGGCGFVGSHLTERLLKMGWTVRVLDNFSRRGSLPTIDHLRGWRECSLYAGDVRLLEDVRRVIPDVDVVFHLAAQVAVTTSVAAPLSDARTNILGTLNVLEAAREWDHPPAVVFASTNKVYGSLSDNTPELFIPVDENTPIDLCSPYGCSKGAADAYVQDYAKTFGLRTAVLRKSCIYGPRQFGCEDQGWLAWFVIAHYLNKSLTIYGTGDQVRDLLHVSDCTAAYLKTAEYLLSLPSGGTHESLVLNIGGGEENAWSLNGALKRIHTMTGRVIPIDNQDFRPGDQLVYVSNTDRAKRVLDWQPQIPATQGLRDLVVWVENNVAFLREVLR